MRIPTIEGLIRRRLLVNFRADPLVVQRLLPTPLRPKLHDGQAIVGICLIRLEQIRPARLPAMFGIASENAAHRMAVVWDDASGQHEGVYIPRRDTGSLVNRLAGGRIFPGEHHAACFDVDDHDGHVELRMHSADGSGSVHVVGHEADSLPGSSCFASLAESSAFFAAGSLGYSATRDAHRLDGLVLHTDHWRVRAFEVSQVESSYFNDRARFPIGSIEFDHALIMRDIPHTWQQAADLCCTAATG